MCLLQKERGGCLKSPRWPLFIRVPDGGLSRLCNSQSLYFTFETASSLPASILNGFALIKFLNFAKEAAGIASNDVNKKFLLFMFVVLLSLF